MKRNQQLRSRCIQPRFRDPALRYRGMPLASELMSEPMRYTCPRCGAVHEEFGSWFRALRALRCHSCREVLPFGYAEKLRLFDEAGRERLRRKTAKRA